MSYVNIETILPEKNENVLIFFSVEIFCKKNEIFGSLSIKMLYVYGISFSTLKQHFFAYTGSVKMDASHFSQNGKLWAK